MGDKSLYLPAGSRGQNANPFSGKGKERKVNPMDNENEFGADLVTVQDEDGNEHQFELIDAIETDDGRYVALLPVYDDPAETLNDDGELIILQVMEEDGEEMLVPIEDDEAFDEIADIFEERLSDLYEIEEMEDEPEN